MPLINSKEFKKLHNIPVNTSLSLKDIAELSDMPLNALHEVYSKGYGAYFSSPNSIRANVKSPEQWAVARVYSFVMRRKNTFGKADRHIAEKYNLI